MTPVVDGGDWIAQRLKHLREALESGDLTDSQRVLVETEIDQLEEEHQRAKRKKRWWMLLGGRRTP